MKKIRVSKLVLIAALTIATGASLFVAMPAQNQAKQGFDNAFGYHCEQNFWLTSYSCECVNASLGCVAGDTSGMSSTF
jgi:hypothetical protein